MRAVAILLLLVLIYIIVKVIRIYMRLSRAKKASDNFNTRRNVINKYKDVEEADFTEIKSDNKSSKE